MDSWDGAEGVDWELPLLDDPEEDETGGADGGDDAGEPLSDEEDRSELRSEDGTMRADDLELDVSLPPMPDRRVMPAELQGKVPWLELDDSCEAPEDTRSPRHGQAEHGRLPRTNIHTHLDKNGAPTTGRGEDPREGFKHSSLPAIVSPRRMHLEEPSSSVVPVTSHFYQDDPYLVLPSPSASDAAEQAESRARRDGAAFYPQHSRHRGHSDSTAMEINAFMEKTIAKRNRGYRHSDPPRMRPDIQGPSSKKGDEEESECDRAEFVEDAFHVRVFQGTSSKTLHSVDSEDDEEYEEYEESSISTGQDALMTLPEDSRLKPFTDGRNSYQEDPAGTTGKKLAEGHATARTELRPSALLLPTRGHRSPRRAKVSQRSPKELRSSGNSSRPSPRGGFLQSLSGRTSLLDGMLELRRKPVALLIDLSGYYSTRTGQVQPSDLESVIPLKTTLLRFDMDGKVRLSEARETFRRQSTPEEFRKDIIKRLRPIADVHQDLVDVIIMRNILWIMEVPYMNIYKWDWVSPRAVDDVRDQVSAQSSPGGQIWIRRTRRQRLRRSATEDFENESASMMRGSVSTMDTSAERGVARSRPLKLVPVAAGKLKKLSPKSAASEDGVASEASSLGNRKEDQGVSEMNGSNERKARGRVHEDDHTIAAEPKRLPAAARETVHPRRLSHSLRPERSRSHDARGMYRDDFAR